MKKIAAFYQCYKQRKSLNYVLQKFRESYPDEKCFLICDGGLDFYEESKKYNCFYSFLEKLETNKNLTFNSNDTCKKFLFRFFSCIKDLEEDYVLILEDDVIVYSKIDLDSLSAQINGCNKNEFLNKNIERLLVCNSINLQSPRGFYYGGCGGSILDIQFFKKALKDEITMSKLVDLYCSFSPKETWASDTILSFICYLCGGKIDQYDGYCETWYPDYKLRADSEVIKVLHQYKDLYE